MSASGATSGSKRFSHRRLRHSVSFTAVHPTLPASTPVVATFWRRESGPTAPIEAFDANIRPDLGKAVLFTKIRIPPSPPNLVLFFQQFNGGVGSRRAAACNESHPRATWRP